MRAQFTPLVTPDGKPVPEHELLKTMNRCVEQVQIWALAAAASPGCKLKASLTPASLSHQYHNEVFYLGQDQGFAWYGFMDIPHFQGLEGFLSFIGGDNVVETLIRGLSIDDQGQYTANSCFYGLGDCGAAALPALDKVLAAGAPQRKGCVVAMCLSKTGPSRPGSSSRPPRRTRKSPPARHGLLWVPRPAATPLYLKWLAEGAGRREVFSEIDACRKTKATAAAASLATVMASPASVRDYCEALETSRELAGKTAMPPAIVAAEARQIIKSGFRGGKLDQAEIDGGVNAILAAGDPAGVRPWACPWRSSAAKAMPVRFDRRASKFCTA